MIFINQILEIMKRSVLIVWAIFLAGCCMSQLPTQYAYVDENCNAFLPDYRDMVFVSDNCNVQGISQFPLPGDPISTTTQVSIRATDEQGNDRVMSFEVILLDTIPPLMQLNPEWQGYTNTEIGNMYKVYYGWVQGQGDIYNERVAGTTDTIQFQDTTLTHTNDTMRIFYGTIPITDPKFRMDNGYWQDETPDLTAWFK